VRCAKLLWTVTVVKVVCAVECGGVGLLLRWNAVRFRCLYSCHVHRLSVVVCAVLLR
jgi:hypothetical protein